MGILTTRKMSIPFTPCVKEVEWGSGWKDLRMLAAFWGGIPVEVTQEAG